jgi:MoaA/NifB/PqqE/SkfB family radical SAM enzyme
MRSPYFVVTELTTRCQLKCKGCFSSPEDYPKGDMDFDFYKSIIDRIDPRTMRLNEYANGEPLLHPRVTEMVEYATAKGIVNYITTNGMIWNEDLFRFIFTHSNLCYQLVVSLDGLPGFESRSIELCRPGSNRAKILDNIARLRMLKWSLGSKTDLIIKACERGQDYEEIENIISYWLSQPGIDVVTIGRLFTSYYQEPMRIYPCQYSDDRFMLIRWNGEIAVCMYHPDVMSKGAIPIGTLDKTTPLLDFYNNEAYTSFRRRQAMGDFPEPCAHCGISYTGTGWRGVMRFRDKRLIQKDIYVRGDHYNTHHSLANKGKPDSEYGYKPL